MTPVAVTTSLLHDLVAGSHAEGVTAMDVTATVDHDGRTLLITQPQLDLNDDTWQLPTGPVRPGETLTDAVAKTLAVIGVHLDQVTGYLGHHDHGDDHSTRVFGFAVTVTNPHGICRTARIGHRWADPDDLPDPPTSPQPHPAAPVNPREPDDPPLAAALRASVRGICAAEAGTELLIGHATWLHRNDFRDRFIHHHTHATGDSDTADIDWRAAITALDSAQLPCSGGEARMLRLAASLVDGIPVNLRDALTGLDDCNLDLVRKAVTHSNRRR